MAGAIEMGLGTGGTAGMVCAAVAAVLAVAAGGSDTVSLTVGVSGAGIALPLSDLLQLSG
jgi:hypothetical protein